MKTATYELLSVDGRTVKKRWNRLAAFVVQALISLSVVGDCRAVDLLYVTTIARSQATPESITSAASFYGMGVVPLTVETQDFLAKARRSLLERATTAVVIDAYALKMLERYSFHDVFPGKTESNQPIFVMGINEETARYVKWIPETRGALQSCDSVQGRDSHVLFSDAASLNQQLTGREMTFAGSFRCAFRPETATALQPIVSIRHQNAAAPVFLKTTKGTREVFIGAQWNSDLAASTLKAKFTSALMPLLFLKHAAGRYGWHTVNRFANLTIDDPWLVGRYGFLDFNQLLKEMQLHGFHTTIAFIPWNYDRSQKQVVSLFTQHSDKYSICIHGNNHDHREFGSYAYKERSEQEFNVRQAVARMERFTAITGIPYDRVMVFPHGISPAPTLRALKKHGFLGTVNAINVPLNEPSRNDVVFPLRSTVMFEDFPSTVRHTAEYSVSEYPHDFPVPKDEIAINAFLGNPILLYGHQGMFASGVGAFNEIADFINTLDQGVAWKSVGHILERSYLQKARLEEEHAFDVLTFSTKTCIVNTNGHDTRFYVRKQEDGYPPVKSMTLAGTAHPFLLADGHISTSVTIAAGKTACLNIEYVGGDSAAPEVSKTSVRVWVLRTISDWRDQYLSHFRIGRFIITAYYGNGRSSGTKALTLVVVGCVGGIMYVWLRRRGNRTFSRRAPQL